MLHGHILNRHVEGRLERHGWARGRSPNCRLSISEEVSSVYAVLILVIIHYEDLLCEIRQVLTYFLF